MIRARIQAYCYDRKAKSQRYPYSNRITTGTHVDAQKHFIANGNSIDKEPLDKFMGEAVTLDISNINIGDGITGSDLENYSKVVKHKDILLLYTGTSDKWTKDDSIRNNFTYLEPSAGGLDR